MPSSNKILINEIINKLTNLFLVIITIISGCKNSFKPFAENGEGTITYKITYSADNPYTNNHHLPGETTLVFKGAKTSFITSGMGIIQVVNLLDNEHKKFTSLLINGLGENFAFTEKPEDVSAQENNPTYKFEMTDEKKMIAGLECNKAIVHDLTKLKKFYIYYYKNVKVVLGNSPYKDFNYLLMEYQDTRYGLPMHLQVIKADFSPVDTTLFEVGNHDEYHWVDRKTFLSIINNLKAKI